MENKTYNGWSNYATWRINLEHFSDRSLEDLKENYEMCEDVYDVAQSIQAETEDYIYTLSENDMVVNYALAFVDDVNWNEIATLIYEDINK